MGGRGEAWSDFVGGRLTGRNRLRSAWREAKVLRARLRTRAPIRRVRSLSVSSRGIFGLCVEKSAQLATESRAHPIQMSAEVALLNCRCLDDRYAGTANMVVVMVMAASPGRDGLAAVRAICCLKSSRDIRMEGCWTRSDRGQDRQGRDDVVFILLLEVVASSDALLLSQLRLLGSYVGASSGHVACRSYVDWVRLCVNWGEVGE